MNEKSKKKYKEYQKAYRKKHKVKRAEQYKAYYAANRERLREKYRLYGRAHPEIARAANLKFNYGLTLEEYEDMYLAVAGHCQICGRHKDQLHVDHNHDTGEVRGLLCNRCNTALGLLQDSPELIARSLQYI